MDARDVLRALDGRPAKHAQHQPPFPVLSSEESEKSAHELTLILIEEEKKICEILATIINGDSTRTRIYVNDLKEKAETKFGEFFRKPRDYRTLRALREWLQANFGDRVRVEGDSRSSGLFFEFS